MKVTDKVPLLKSLSGQSRPQSGKSSPREIIDKMIGPKDVFTKLIAIIKNMTVEPVMFLVFFGMSVDRITVQQMQIYKSCKIDFKYNDTICDDLVHWKEENEIVQDHVSSFYLYHTQYIKTVISICTFQIAQFNVYVTIVDNIIPTFMSFYFGAWCDILGRKTVMYSHLTGRMFSHVLLLLNAYFLLEWPNEYYLFTVVVPAAVFGPLSAFFMASNAFISDICSPEDRSFRLGMAQVVGVIGRPLGTLAGGFILEHGIHKLLNCQFPK